MTTQELLQRLNTILESFEEKLDAVTEERRELAQCGKVTSYQAGQEDILESVCVALDALVLEAAHPKRGQIFEWRTTCQALADERR